jgi:hypothetical protein
MIGALKNEWTSLGICLIAASCDSIFSCSFSRYAAAAITGKNDDAAVNGYDG